MEVLEQFLFNTIIKYIKYLFIFILNDCFLNIFFHKWL